MIGVICKNEEKETAKEFFELFKIPWEFFREGVSYPVILSTDGWEPCTDARLIILYGSDFVNFDEYGGVSLNSTESGRLLYCGDVSLPAYGRISTFDSEVNSLLKVKSDEKPVAFALQTGSQKIIRVGYDLFLEINHLLSHGQPTEHAPIPTLEIHISFLRKWILESGVPLIEIPPVPYGYDFIACLTHDIDFAAIRDHKFDHTMFGFLYRAIVGTFIDALRGKASWKKFKKNLHAVLLLPGIHLGITKDFWSQFTRYLELEKGLKSTFFFLPYKGVGGRQYGGRLAPKKRASKYDVDHVRRQISRLVFDGCEIGLHGIDAWWNPEIGKCEAGRIESVIGKPVRGVRIHWLYLSRESPALLEQAGLSYDSSFGYNDAVGFRAGTAQVFRPAGSERLIELPLLIQDTSMFYSGRMRLREDVAFTMCQSILEKVATFGGVLVLNWHDRSLAPERLWDAFYLKLLCEIKSYRVWFGTGAEVTDWFRRRRLMRFARAENGNIRIELQGSASNSGPDLELLFYGASENDAEFSGHRKGCKEMRLQGEMELEIPMRQNATGTILAA